MRVKVLMALASFAVGGCITLPHEPTPGWQCRAAPYGHYSEAFANVALDGKLLETSWYWNWRNDSQGWSLRAYAGDGHYRRGEPVPLDGPTEVGIFTFGASGASQVVLSHVEGETAFASAIETGAPGDGNVKLDWDRLVALARETAPLYAVRRGKDGTTASLALPKDEIVMGADILAETLADLREKVADPANNCVAVDDLYPEIIVT